MLEVVGTIIEGPITEEESRKGAIKLVDYGGDIEPLYETEIHPCFATLRAGQLIVKYISDNPDARQRTQVKLYRGGE
jgi:hypothetical protein